MIRWIFFELFEIAVPVFVILIYTQTRFALWRPYEGAHMDFHGLQSHFKGGIDGQLVQERLNEMAGPEMSNRLMITEFDVEEENVEERAEDVQDFLRRVFK